MAAGGSNVFAATVGNLRHYLRDRQSQQPPPQQQKPMPEPTEGLELRLALPVPAPTEGADDKTMQLFPKSPTGMSQEKSQILTEAKGKDALTIMYQGEVHVFRDFPRERNVSMLQTAAYLLASSVPGSGSRTGPVMMKRSADAPLEDVFDTKVPRKVTLRHCPRARSHEGIAKEEEGVDLTAMEDKPSPSWLGL